VLLVSDGGDQRYPTLLPLRLTTQPDETPEPAR
jgi:hypothetical protein